MIAGLPPPGDRVSTSVTSPDVDTPAGELLEDVDDEPTPPAAGGWVCQCVCDNPGLVHR